MTIRCIVIDDEAFAKRELEAMIGQTEGLTVAASFTDPGQALAYLGKNRDSADIVFLDVEMQGMNGIDLANKLGSGPFSIVFTTAHPQFAASAFRVEAVDYLLKPILKPEFLEAVERCRQRLQLRNFLQKHMDAYFFVKDFRNGKRIKIAKNDVVCAKTLGNYTKLHLMDGFQLMHLPLKKTYMMLGTPNFVQIHRFYIINLDKVVHFDYGSVLLANGEELDIGQTFRKRVNSLLNRPGARTGF